MNVTVKNPQLIKFYDEFGFVTCVNYSIFKSLTFICANKIVVNNIDVMKEIKSLKAENNRLTDELHIVKRDMNILLKYLENSVNEKALSEQEIIEETLRRC